MTAYFFSSAMEKMSRHGWKHTAIFSLKCILKHHIFYSTSVKATVSSGRNSLSSFQSYLVGSLGFSEKQALSASSKLARIQKSRGQKKISGFIHPGKAHSVVSFLEQKGLKKTQIRNLVFAVPQILAVRVKQNLEPKMKTFQEIGLSVSDFADFISTKPNILQIGLHSTIHPAIEALREVVGCNKDVVRVMKQLKFCGLSSVPKYLVLNVSLLRARGVPIEYIRKRILNRPRAFMRRTEELEHVMTQVEEKWRVSASSSMFIYALDLLTCLNEKNIESKCRVFESFGWDRSDVVNLFGQNPTCLSISPKKIKVVLNFYMNDLGYDLGYIVSHSALVNYSMEKRVFPRYKLMELLREKGLIGHSCGLYSAVIMTESQFLKRFVQPFEDDVPNLREIYSNYKGKKDDA